MALAALPQREELFFASITGHLSKYHGGHCTSVRPLPTMASLSSYDLGLNFSRVRAHRLAKYKVCLFGG